MVMDCENNTKNIINPNYSSIRYTQKKQNGSSDEQQITISLQESDQPNELSINEQEEVVGWNKDLKRFEVTKYEASDKNILSNAQMTTKEKLDHIMHSDPVHIAVIALVLLDSILVIFALLVDVDIIDIPEDHLVVSVFHGFSIAILSIFMVEISIKIYANHKHFLHHKMEVVDAVVVVISFILDITLVFFENAGLEALGLLVLFRLWRVCRIINGFIVTVKNKADQRVHFVKRKNKELELALIEMQEDIKEKEQAMEYYKNLLEENDISFSKPIFHNREDENTRAEIVSDLKDTILVV